MGNGYTRFFPKPIWRVSDVHAIEGALDKYNIYLSISVAYSGLGQGPRDAPLTLGE